MRTQVTAFLFFFMSFPLTVSLAGAESHDVAAVDPCDPGLIGNVHGELAYQRRETGGVRCEGVYRNEVSGEISFDSLVESFEDFDTTDPRDLEVLWSLPPGMESGTVRLRARALMPDTFYRMDAVVAAHPSGFVWPCEVLDELGYRSADVGALGWIDSSSPASQVYLPLRIRQQETAARSGVYEGAFTPGRRLEQVFVSVRPAGADGKVTGPPLAEAEDLGAGPYPGGMAVFFELPALPATGFYQLEITVTFPEEGSEISEYLFYHEEP